MIAEEKIIHVREGGVVGYTGGHELLFRMGMCHREGVRKDGFSHYFHISCMISSLAIKLVNFLPC